MKQFIFIVIFDLQSADWLTVAKQCKSVEGAKDTKSENFPRTCSVTTSPETSQAL